MPRFFQWLSSLPLIGPLVSCSKSDHKDAVVELIINLVFSTMPLWLGAFVVLIMDNSINDLLDALNSNINTGELFLYSSALLAPVFYMSLYDKPGAYAFPSKLSHIVVVVLLILLSAVVFGLQRANISLNAATVFTMSKWFYLIAIVILYLALVYHNARLPSPSDAMKNSEEDFMERLKRHRG